MTIKTNIFGLEVEVKAKGLANTNRFNKEDTLTFLNQMCIYANETRKLYNAEGSFALADEAEEFGEMLYQLLKKNKYYDN